MVNVGRGGALGGLFAKYKMCVVFCVCVVCVCVCVHECVCVCVCRGLVCMCGGMFVHVYV